MYDLIVIGAGSGGVRASQPPFFSTRLRQACQPGLSPCFPPEPPPPLSAAASSKTPAITDLKQLANMVVGVQSGSVYETTQQEDLVTPGLMPAQNLQSYPDIDQAVNDLKRNRLDAVVLDLQPAQAFVSSGGVKLIGEGIKPQDYAIGIPKGAESLRRVLNQAIAEVIANGTYGRLAETFLGLTPADVIPLPPVTEPTPAPSTPTPAAPLPTPTPAGCIDNMSYVADLNYDDKNMTAPPVLQPGQQFVKSWRIRNTGTCAWDSKYFLAYSSGNSPLAQMGGQPTYIKGTVPPGATYDISVSLTAPTQPGVYQGFWQMNNAKGQGFGTKVYVGIQVAAPTATPAPTQTPSPSISFTVNQTNITAGECVQFSWNVQNVQAVYFYAQGQNPQGVAGQGTRTECPAQTTTYYLSVVFTNGSSSTQAITINVAAPPVGAPVIVLFAATPAQINQGQCVTLQWEVQGSVQQITLARNGTALWSGAPVRGTMQDCPPGAGSMAYTLQAIGPGGQNGSQRIVNVVAPATAVPPTAVPPTAVPPTAVPPTAVPPTAVPPTATPQPPSIQGKNWVVTTYNNGQGALASPLAGTTLTALFGADGKVSGSDGCNTYTAPYTLSGTSLTIGAPVLTGMACPDDVMAQAQQYVAALQQTQRYEAAGNQLTLLAASGQKLVQYVAQ